MVLAAATQESEDVSSGSVAHGSTATYRMLLIFGLGGFKAFGRVTQNIIPEILLVVNVQNDLSKTL